MRKIMAFLAVFPNSLMASRSSGYLVNDAANSGDFLKMMLGLITVLAVIFALAFVVKRMNGIKLGFTGSQYFKLISAFSLGTKDKLVLVKAGERYLLLGVSNNGINKLHDYGTELNIDELEKESVNFSSLFNKFKKENN